MNRWHAYLPRIPERPEYEIVEMTNGTVIAANIGRALPGVTVYSSMAEARADYSACRWVSLDTLPTGEGEPKGETAE